MSDQSTEIQSSQILLLIQQYLKENNLTSALDALQKETTEIAYNVVSNKAAFYQDICQGNWDVVLKQTKNFDNRHLKDLYEQITLELIEMKEFSAARSLLRQTQIMQDLKEDYPDRFLLLEQFLSNSSFFDNELAYPNGSTKESKRKLIANDLINHVTEIAPSRLLSLLGQSIKYQHSIGIIEADKPFDLFTGKTTQINATDSPPTTKYNIIKFPKKSHVETAIFSVDGQYLITGSFDGFIEIWNHTTAKLRKDLLYQAQNNPMLMDSPVLALAISKNNTLLASGDQLGNIYVWKIDTGLCIKKFKHPDGVTNLKFDSDGTKVLSCGFDFGIRLFGMKSGKVLKEFSGHSGFVNDVLFSNDGHHIVSASSDGTVKIFDKKSTSCLHTVSLSQGKKSSSNSASSSAFSVEAVIKLILLSNGDFLVLSKSQFVYQMNIKGQILKVISNPVSKTHFTNMVLSPRNELVYAVGEDKEVYCFDLGTGKMKVQFKVSETSEVIGICHHPFINVLGVFCEDGELSLWKA